MLSELEIRKYDAADRAAIESLYPEAFPDEDLLPLVRDLLSDESVAVSLVACSDSQVVGHVILTLCGVEGCSVRAALLGPVAVAPAWQRQGIGSAIVRAGLEWAKESNVELICVLGDPGYYSRLGFVPETSVAPPYPLPPEWAGAWQTKHVRQTERTCAGTLTVPSQWRDPALWGP